MRRGSGASRVCVCVCEAVLVARDHGRSRLVLTTVELRLEFFRCAVRLMIGCLAWVEREVGEENVAASRCERSQGCSFVSIELEENETTRKEEKNSTRARAPVQRRRREVGGQ